MASSVPENIDSQPDYVADGPRKERKGRGPTRAANVWNLKEGKKIRITLNNLGQVVEDSAKELTKFLGTIARNGSLTPLCYKEWRVFPKHRKEETWKLIQSKFDISMHGKAFVLRSIGKKWKDYKAELKSEYYEPYNTLQTMSNCPKEVIQSQWEWLVAFWDSPEGKNKSAKNKRSRSRQNYAHTGGSKSNARLRQEMAKEMGLAEGEEPSKAEVWIRTHRKKGGEPMDEETQNAIHQLESVALERSETNGGTPNPTNEDFERCFGPERYGYVRTYGLGVAPTNLGRKRKTMNSDCYFKEDGEDRQNEIVEMKTKFVEMENKNKELEENMKRILSMLPANHHVTVESDRQIHENSSPLQN